MTLPDKETVDTETAIRNPPSEIRILLIEDNPGDARLIQEMLIEAGSNQSDLERCDRLSAGLERINSGGVDALLLDLGLPDSNGIDTFLRVYAQAPEVPTVVLTGLDDEMLANKLVINSQY
jgi:DNA-binding response OmpR family regulator